jgi:hypothetical protein
LADRECSICGSWLCRDCAPVHAAVDEPVCAPCTAALLRRTVPSRSRRPVGVLLLGLLLVGALAAILLRPAAPEQTASRAWRVLERTGEALEAYSAVEGRYPDDLEQLVPRELSSVPEDPWSPGNPLRYSPPPGNPAGRILYSVGPDRLDQRGVPRDPVTGAGDLVYPVR